MSIYTETRQIPDSGWSAEALFTVLQDISGDAVAKAHATGADLKKLGLMWVVTRYDVRLSRAPVPGETLHFETWAEPFRHHMSQRSFLAFDDAGNTVLSGAGIWAVVDRASRSMVDADACGVVFPTETERPPLAKPAAPEKLSRRTADGGLSPNTDSYRVKPEDLDMNGHMNNTRYFSVAEGLLPDTAKPAFLSRARVSFHSEALLGEELAILWQLQEENSCMRLSLEAQTEGKDRFRMTLEYAV